MKQGFIFHATSIYSGGRKLEGWDDQDRFHLLHGMMALSRELKLPIALGIQRKNQPGMQLGSFSFSGIGSKISQSDFEHIMAFGMCVARADKFLREHTPEDEVATVICEDVPRIRAYMRKTVDSLRKNPRIYDKEFARPTLEEKRTGIIRQQSVFKVEKIIDSLHFVEKKDGPILQIADACAYVFNRYFNEKPDGKAFLSSVLGSTLVDENWAGPWSGATFFREKKPTSFYEQVKRLFSAISRLRRL